MGGNRVWKNSLTIMKKKIEKAIREKEKYIEDKIKSIQKTLREMRQWWKKRDEHEVYMRAAWISAETIAIREAIDSIWTLVDLWEELSKDERK